MITFFLFLLPAFAVALETHDNVIERQLQSPCQGAYNDVAACNQANKDACTNDDPANQICFPDSGANNTVIPANVGNSDYCELYKFYFCTTPKCCKGLCTTQYQAYAQCLATVGYGCGTLSCGGGGGGGCFSATSTAQVLGQGHVHMQDLQVGDVVLTGSPGSYKYQPVYAFGHLNKQSIGAFYAIGTKASKMPLEMTGEHLVYLARKANPVRADSLLVGDTLMSIHGPAEITSIDIVAKQGLFNPLTADGRLIVNDLAVSTYIALQQKESEHFQIVLDKQGPNNINLISHQNFVHLYLAPFRMLCMGISSQLCQVHDAEGIPLYISLGMKLVQWVGDQNVVIQLVFLLVTLPLYVLFWAVENLVGSSVAALAFFALALFVKRAPALNMKQPKVA